MKPELLATLAILTSQLNSLPEDQEPPATPTGLAIASTTGTDPLSIELVWDAIEGACESILDYKSAVGNPNGPQDWGPVSPSPILGLSATLVLNAPTGQALTIRLRIRRNRDSQFSESVYLAFPVL